MRPIAGSKLGENKFADKLESCLDVAKPRRDHIVTGRLDEFSVEILKKCSKTWSGKTNLPLFYPGKAAGMCLVYSPSAPSVSITVCRTQIYNNQ